MKHGNSLVMGLARRLLAAASLPAFAAQANDYSVVNQWLREGRLQASAEPAPPCAAASVTVKPADTVAAYDANIEPPGHAPSNAWEADRRLRVIGKSHRSINLTELKVTENGNRAVAKFRQADKAVALAVTSRKPLELAKTGDRWLSV